MELDKLTLYRQLVLKRISCKKCDGLVNPSMVKAGIFDSEHIGPWSLLQGSLNAKLMILGQDWGDLIYFINSEGKGYDDNPTRDNLIRLLQVMGISCGSSVSQEENDILFFTNAILCLKQGGLSSKVKDEWFVNCGELFLKPLIEIIKPKIVVALGIKAYNIIVLLYKLKTEPFSKVVERKEPIRINENTGLFVVYHCGVYGVNINRKFSQQIVDWKRMEPFL
jgi:DNA polymerase